MHGKTNIMQFLYLKWFVDKIFEKLSQIEPVLKYFSHDLTNNCIKIFWYFIDLDRKSTLVFYHIKHKPVGPLLLLNAVVIDINLCKNSAKNKINLGWLFNNNYYSI